MDKWKQEVYDQLCIDEGVKYVIYNDHLGYPTFGVGHLITKSDEEFGRPIGATVSEERVRSCFQRDLDTSIAECNTLYGEREFAGFPSEVQQILVNMMFNLGRPRLSKYKKMHAALSKKDWKEAAKEGRDSLWYRQVTNRAERLMSRLENIS